MQSILSLALDDRVVALGVAKRQLFVEVTLRASTPEACERVRALRDEVEWMLSGYRHHLCAAAVEPGGGGSDPVLRSCR